jgi:hypothetical protein
MEGTAKDAGKQGLATLAKDPAATSYADSPNSLAHAEAASWVQGVHRMRENKGFLKCRRQCGRVRGARFVPLAGISPSVLHQGFCTAEGVLQLSVSKVNP